MPNNNLEQAVLEQAIFEVFNIGDNNNLTLKAVKNKILNRVYLKYDKKTKTFSTYEALKTPLEVSFQSHFDDKDKMIKLILEKIKHFQKSKEHYTYTIEKPFRIYKEHEKLFCIELNLDASEPTAFKRYLKNKKTITSSELLKKIHSDYVNQLAEINNSLEDLNNKLVEVNNITFISGYFENFKLAEEAGAISSNLLKTPINSDYVLKDNISPNVILDLHKSKDPVSKKLIMLDYHGNDDNAAFRQIKQAYKHNPVKPDKHMIQLAKLLKGLSFGFEIETNKGVLRHDSLLKYYGLVPLKDGSIKGYEYVTVPLGLKDNKPDVFTLAKDLKVFYEGVQELSKVATVDNNCSFHVHIGGMRKDKEFMLAFYKLCILLQNEIFLTQPLFKQDGVKYLGLKKNYCKKLPKLNLNYNFKVKDKEYFKDSVHQAYNELFKFLSNGEPLSKEYNRLKKVHPKGKKWDRTERYNWVNMVNTVFNKEETIEFRLHSGTVNPDKMINWMFLCAAMTKFTENNIYGLLTNSVEVNLERVLQGYATNFRSKKRINPLGLEISSYLINYFEDRKKYFKDNVKDIYADFEFVTDLDNIKPGIKITPIQ